VTTPDQHIPRPPARSRWPWITAAILAIALAAAAATYLLMPTDEGEAADRCRDAVTEQLKAPATADFGDATVTREDGDFGSYFEVTGKVDAQNGFGALARNTYRCKLQLEKNGTWLMTSTDVSAR